MNSKTAYKALIFDFDYTLGDTTLSIAASINYALGRLGYPAHSVEEIKKTIGLSLNIAFRMLTGDEDDEKEALFFDYFQIEADEVMTNDAQLYPHTERLLREWKKTYKIGIVSSKHRFRIVDILKKFHLEDAVDAIAGNEDVKNEKPHPEGVLLAAEKLGAKAEEVLYIGDSVVDAEAAQRAGFDFAAVLTGTTPREAFLNYPNVLIAENLLGIEEFLKK